MSYGTRILSRMHEIARAELRTLTIKDLAGSAGYSREQVRKVVRGLPVVSRTLNDRLCRVLGLDPESMWELAQREKSAQPPLRPSSGNVRGQALVTRDARQLRRQLAHATRRLEQVQRDLTGICSEVARAVQLMGGDGAEGPEAVVALMRKRRPRPPATDETRRRISESQRRRWAKKQAKSASVGDHGP